MQFIKAADLRIDPYLKQLLTEVEGEDELEEVEIFPDGSWKRRLEKESVSEPPVKKVKAEQAEVSTLPADATSISFGVPAAPTDALNGAAGLSSTAPVEIDLLSSDDEVEKNTARRNMPNVTTVSTTPILLDDDIDILTVGSDVWDTPVMPAPPSNTASGGSDGNCGEYFPFPLDENLFPSNGTSASTASSTSSSWMYAVPTSTIVNSMPPATSTVAASTPLTVSPLQELLNQAESNLASSMASLSRNHNVNNPFDQRPRRQARLPPKPAATPSNMDIICLLDSDSE